LLAAAVVWAATFYPSIWGHLDAFSKWPGALSVPAPK